MIHIQGLSKSFTQGNNHIKIFDQGELQVEKGKQVALRGESGSGKSTFLSILSGLDNPDSGKVMVAGKDISKLNERELCHYRAKDIGIIFQNFRLIPYMTALENVMLPLQILGKGDDQKIGKDILAQVGLKDRFEHYPTELSGGECQRVAMARALVKQPALILADEPTGSLDENTGEKVLDLLFGLLKQYHVTSLIVTHSPELAKRCDLEYRITHQKFHLCSR